MPSRSRLAGSVVLLAAAAAIAVRLVARAGSFSPGYHKPAPYQTPPTRLPPGIQKLGGGGAAVAPTDASPVTRHFSAADTGAVSASDSGYHKAAPYQTPPNRMPPGIQPAGSHPQLDSASAESAASPVTMHFSAAPAADTGVVSASDSGYHKAAPYQTPPNRMPPGIQPAGSHPQLTGVSVGDAKPAASSVTMQAVQQDSSAADSGYHKPAPYQTPPNRMPPGIQPAGSHPQLQ